MSNPSKCGKLSLKLLLTTLSLLLLLSTGALVDAQPTYPLKERAAMLPNFTVSDSHQDINVVLSNVMISQLKLMALIFDEISKENGRKTARQSVQQTSEDKTGQRVVVLVQQHYGGTTFFNRTWDEYKFEFGDVTGNYWIGNERLHQLTKDDNYKLRVDLEARFNGRRYWAEYQTFRVWDESTQYRLDVGGYNGTAGDSFAVHNGMKFSTRDRDNDRQSNGSCCTQADGGNFSGFWYNNCKEANINSPYGGCCGFSWYRLPIGSGWTYTSLLTSRLSLIPKGSQ